MQVFKFGGASVKDANGIRNLLDIIQQNRDKQIFIVVSAMGKTTNKLEEIHAAYYAGKQTEAMQLCDQLQQYHNAVIKDLYSSEQELNTTSIYNATNDIFKILEEIINSNIDTDFDRSYDNIISKGELLSTLIIHQFLESKGITNTWIDMTKVMITDHTYREANIDLNQTHNQLLKATQTNDQLFIAQGFIGGTTDNHPTTLGREGSDYTAAIVANLLDAESVTIWKDVPGIMNADPRIFPNAIHIPELTYYDAVELTYSGAQVIHPKTIRPLENKHITLYVKPFADHKAKGSIISKKVNQPINVPIYILRKNQVLITIRPHDFSFVLEQSLSQLFNIIEKHRLKVTLIQSSAVTISVCVDKSRYLQNAIDELNNNYKVSYNDGLCLLTVRGTTQEIINEVEQGKDILLKQTTRRTLKIIYRQ